MSGAAAAYVALRNARQRQEREQRRMISGSRTESSLTVYPRVQYKEDSMSQATDIHKPSLEMSGEQSKLQRILKQVGIGTRRIAIVGALAYALFFPHSCTSVKEINDVPHHVSIHNFRIIPLRSTTAEIDLVKNEEQYIIDKGFFRGYVRIDNNLDNKADWVVVNERSYLRSNSSGKITDSVFKYADEELARVKKELRVEEVLDKVRRNTQ
jgi:hypothetical protein